jgi:uncharacterized protein (DUF433 family)
MWHERIITDDNVLCGKPIIKDTRISVEFIIELLSEGWKIEDVLKNYPQLAEEDIMAALKYSAEVVKREKTFAL